MIGSKLSAVTRHAWSSKSSLKINTTKNSVTFRSSLLAFDLRESGLFERVSLAQIHFCCFFEILALLMRFAFNRSYLPGQNLSKYKQGPLRLNIAWTARYWSQRFYLHRVREFRTHIWSSKIVYHKLPELSSTHVRRLNQPSLQSRSEVVLYWVWFGT